MPLQLFENCLALLMLWGNHDLSETAKPRKVAEIPCCAVKKNLRQHPCWGYRGRQLPLRGSLPKLQILSFSAKHVLSGNALLQPWQNFGPCLGPSYVQKKYLQFDTTTNCLFDVFHPQRPPPATPWLLFSIQGPTPAVSFQTLWGWDRVMLSKVSRTFWKKDDSSTDLTIVASIHEMLPGSLVFSRPGAHTGLWTIWNHVAIELQSLASRCLADLRQALFSWEPFPA